MSSHPSWLNKHFVPRQFSCGSGHVGICGSGKTAEDGRLMKPHSLGIALDTMLVVSMTPKFTTTQKVSKAGGLCLGSQELKYKSISAPDVLYGLRQAQASTSVSPLLMGKDGLTGLYLLS